MNWETVGSIGVDAGLCWIGDPCHFYPRVRVHREFGYSLVESACDYDSLIDEHLSSGHASCHTVVKIPYDTGHEGAAVIVQSGDGDGCYPVQVRRTKDGRVAEVRVTFIEKDESCNDSE